MFQTKRFGLVASKQEYLMLCHAERTLKHKKKPTGQRLPAFKVHKNRYFEQFKEFVTMMQEVEV